MVPSSGTVIWKSDEDFQQVGLELLVRPVDLIDQQYRRDRPADGLAAAAGFSRVVHRRKCAPQSRPHPIWSSCSWALDRQKLALVVPLIDRLVGIEALIALQPDQLGPLRWRQSALPISVLPTPASPSSSSGRCRAEG